MSDTNPDRSLAPVGNAPHPFFWSAEVLRWVTPLRERVQRLRQHPLPSATLQSLRMWFRTQHVFHSNAIEGSTLTLYETQVVIGDGLTVGGKPLRDVLAARNLAHALDWVEDLGRGDGPISERNIREIHGLVMQGEDESLPGRYKTENNRVAGAVFRTPTSLQTPSLMEALGRYLAVLETDAIVSSAVAHAWMVGIHPFRDGNGRTARLLANLVLIRKGYPVALLTEDRRPDYYATLDRAHCTGDLTDFIALWCDCVDKTLQEHERLGGALEAREREVEYMASAVNLSHAANDAVLLKWQGAIAALAGELRLVAQSLNARIHPDAGRVSVKDGSVTASSMAQARNGMTPVIELSGQLQGRPFASHVSLGTTDAIDAPEGMALHVDSPPRPASRKRLIRLHLDGPRLKLVWHQPDGSESEESGKTFTEAATFIFREAFDRAAGDS